MALYQGSASVVNGSDTVNVTGLVLSPISIFAGATVAIDGEAYFLDSTINTTSFKLSRTYSGTTASGLPLEINTISEEQVEIVRLNRTTATLLEQFSLLDANTQGLFFQYSDTNTSGDPGPGRLTYNNVTVANRTQIYIDALDNNSPNRNVGGLIGTWAAGTTLVIRSLETTAYEAYRLTGPATDNTGWFTLNVAFVGADGVIGNGEQLAVGWYGVGQGLQIDAVGTFAQRSTYDAQPAGFTFASTNGNGTAGSPSGLYRKNSNTSGDWSGLISTQGPTGNTGYSPVFSLVTDGARRVLRLTDWVGGQGTKPAVGQYIGATGLVTPIASAIDVRGSEGQQGIQGLQGTPGIQGIQGIQGVMGPNGLTAYQVAVANGYAGSETDWLDSLIGPAGLDGTDPGILFAWSTTTADANPGAGLIRANNASITAASFLYVSKTNRVGNDISTFLAGLTASTNPTTKGILTLTNANSETQTVFNVTDVVDATGYVKVAVTDGSGATSFGASDPISFQFARSGNKGVDGLGAGDVIGPAGATNDALVAFDTTTGKRIKDTAIPFGDVLRKSENLSNVASSVASYDNLNVKGTTIPSAATINLETATGTLIDISGTASISAVTLNAGHHRLARATGAFTLTSGTNLTLNTGGISYTAAVGDLFLFVGDAGSPVRVAIFPVSGRALVGGGDVVGPASSVAGRVATFSNATGKLLADGGILASNIATINSPNIFVGAQTFTGAAQQVVFRATDASAVSYLRWQDETGAAIGYFGLDNRTGNNLTLRRNTVGNIDIFSGTTGTISFTGVSTFNQAVSVPNGVAAINAVNKGQLDAAMAAAIPADGSITNAKLANMATTTVKGRISAGAGVPEDLTSAQVWSLLGVAPIANAYSQSTILGTVSQASGVPTGAIIEQGSNANGRYVRYADGTQIAWFTSASFSATGAGAGTAASPYSTLTITWNHPVSFSSRPVVNTNVFSGGNANDVMITNMFPGSSATQTLCRAVGAINGGASLVGDSCTVDFVAVGRWF